MEFMYFLGFVGIVSIGAIIWALIQLHKQKQQAETDHHTT